MLLLFVGRDRSCWRESTPIPAYRGTVRNPVVIGWASWLAGLFLSCVAPQMLRAIDAGSLKESVVAIPGPRVPVKTHVKSIPASLDPEALASCAPRDL